MAIAITRTLAACALLSALPAAAQQPAATAYPERPVRVVVPVAPGGSTDLVARIMSGKLGDALGRTFVVDNRAGAGALIGTDVVAKAAPDGYTLLFAYAAHTIAPFIFSRVPYDVFNDFTPITLVASQPLLLTINPSIGTSSVKELIALAKAKPGQLNVGLATPSSSGALIAEWFKVVTHTNITSVPFKGGALAMTALLQGEIQFMFATAPAAMPHLKSEKARVIATSGDHRLSYLPEVPTFDEAGLKGFEAEPWGGFLGPARLRRAIVDRIYQASTESLKQADTRERLAASGNVPVGSSPEKFAQRLARELRQNAELIKRVGMKAD